MRMSESINELAAALSKAQGQIKNAVKDSDNPFFRSKYADLAAVWNACREPLASNGLAVVQIPEVQDGKPTVHTILMHSSGQWIDGELAMTPTKNDPQGIGSVITYAKRYSLSGMAGVATEDDDGNAASNSSRGSMGGREVLRTTEDMDIGGTSKAAAIQEGSGIAAVAEIPTIPTVAELRAEAKQMLSTKPASLPENAIAPGQAVNFAKLFKDALKPHLRKDSSDIEHAWLKKQGIVDGDGNGTAKAILKDSFYLVREQALNYAASLE